MLQEDQWQGRYGEKLVLALAAAAGIKVSHPDPDADGVDLTLSYLGRYEGRGFPAIDVQIKSWCIPQIRGDVLAYPLRAHNFNLLTGRVGIDFSLPRLLFLVVVPRREDGYASFHDDHYRFQNCVYWHSVMNEQPLPPGQTSKTVYVPVSNIVTAGNLPHIVGREYGEEAA